MLNKNYKKVILALTIGLVSLNITACNNEEAKAPAKEVQTVEETTEEAKTTPATEEATTEETSTEDNEVASEETNNGEASTTNQELTVKVIVDVDYVKDIIDGNVAVDDYVIAEVTWGDSEASPSYLTSHLPEAIHINTDDFEEGPVWNFKSDDEIVDSLLKYGVDKDTTLIVYGPDSGAARVALAAMMEGVENIKLMDGGLTVWEAKGYDTEDGEVAPLAKSDFGREYPARPELIVSLDEAIADIENEDDDKQYIATDTYDEYTGKISGYSYIPKAGELPGALWGHDEADYKNEDGTYISYEDMVAMLEGEGVDITQPMIFYCGTGWRAALPMLRFYDNGIETKLFDGGWNEWQMHDELLAQVGDLREGSELIPVGDLSNEKAQGY